VKSSCREFSQNGTNRTGVGAGNLEGKGDKLISPRFDVIEEKAFQNGHATG
jgi:hypothetical protein